MKLKKCWFSAVGRVCKVRHQVLRILGMFSEIWSCFQSKLWLFKGFKGWDQFSNDISVFCKFSDIIYRVTPTAHHTLSFTLVSIDRYRISFRMNIWWPCLYGIYRPIQTVHEETRQIQSPNSFSIFRNPWRKLILVKSLPKKAIKHSVIRKFKFKWVGNRFCDPFPSATLELLAIINQLVTTYASLPLSEFSSGMEIAKREIERKEGKTSFRGWICCLRAGNTLENYLARVFWVEKRKNFDLNFLFCETIIYSFWWTQAW